MPGIAPASTQLLQDHWIEELGCTSPDLLLEKIKVVPHGTLRGYRGVKFFRRNQTCIVSAPEEMVAPLTVQTSGMRAEECFTPAAIASLLGERLDQIIGPAWLGQIEARSFRACHGAETTLLQNSEDHAGLKHLLAACTESEAQNSSLEAGRTPTVGIFSEGHLCAAAGYEILGNKVAHIGVLCHPQHRGQGLAAKVISGITEIALRANLGIQYQTLCANRAAIGAARRIGYQEFALTLAARLRDIEC